MEQEHFHHLSMVNFDLKQEDIDIGNLQNFYLN